MFGMGFTEIMVIAVIAILFLGPDKLPSAMIDIAKFFRNVKRTVGGVKESIEQEMNVADLKEEALAYKKELLEAQNNAAKVTSMANIGDLSDLADELVENKPKKIQQDVEVKEEKVSLNKKSKKEDSDNV